MPNLTFFWSICYVLYQIFRHFVVFDTLQMQTANTKKTKHKHIIFVYNIDQNFTYVCKILVNLLYFCISHLC